MLQRLTYLGVLQCTLIVGTNRVDGEIPHSGVVITRWRQQQIAVTNLQQRSGLRSRRCHIEAQIGSAGSDLKLCELLIDSQSNDDAIYVRRTDRIGTRAPCRIALELN